MRKIVFTMLLGLLFVGCRQEIKEAELSKINGYWEIEKAKMPDGSKKEYSVNTTIDYFEIKGNKGLRKKVMPQLDGRYLMNDISETITIENKDGNFVMNYSTSYAKWKEELLELSDDHLVVKNDQDIEYTYKRAKPFSVK
ncbi:lipocalin family protein [Flavobacterium pedocola]